MKQTHCSSTVGIKNPAIRYARIHRLHLGWFFAAAIGAVAVSCSDPVQRQISRLQCRDLDACKSAARELGEMGDPRAVEPMIACLMELNRLVSSARNSGSDREYANARVNLAEALGQLHDARAVEPLIEFLKEPDSRMPAGVRNGNAERALANIGRPAVEPLLVCFTRERDIRGSLASVLGELGDTRAREPLRAALPNWGANRSIVWALKRLGWRPQSSAEQVYQWIGEQNTQALRQAWADVRKVLLADVVSGDAAKIENAVYTVVSLGRAEMIPVLKEILESQGNEPMAETFLNCGQNDLAEAARSWAAKRGYRISTGSGAHSANWGRW